MGIFKISVTNLHWIDGTLDNPDDFCLHGDPVAIIGEFKLEYKDATVSATALYLLKTITENHYPGKDNQMLPCCGFSMIPDTDLQNVTIIGCPNGVDWKIEHSNKNVIITLDNGHVEMIDIEDYKKEVFAFADLIEGFFNRCKPKRIDTLNQADKDGYIAFWNEWRRRRNGK